MHSRVARAAGTGWHLTKHNCVASLDQVRFKVTIGFSCVSLICCVHKILGASISCPGDILRVGCVQRARELNGDRSALNNCGNRGPVLARVDVWGFVCCCICVGNLDIVCVHLHPDDVTVDHERASRVQSPCKPSHREICSQLDVSCCVCQSPPNVCQVISGRL